MQLNPVCSLHAIDGGETKRPFGVRNKERNVKEAKRFIKANQIRRQSLVVAGMSGMADLVSLVGVLLVFLRAALR